jgi:hypothetical protein
MGFRDFRTTRKGEIGERIARQWLISRGYEIYTPGDLEKSHTNDILAMRRDCHNGLIVCDAKAKPARVDYGDTGIDLEHWHRYKSLSEAHGMRAFLFFVDEDEGTIRGNYLDVLDARRHGHRSPKTGRRVLPNYPLVQNNLDSEIRYYDLENLPIIGRLTADEIAELRSLSTRDPKYQTVADERWRGRLL